MQKPEPRLNDRGGKMMKYFVSMWVVISLVLCVFVVPVGCQQKSKDEATQAGSMETAATETMGEGAALFKKHCAVCHPDGGNIINAKKTLSRKSLEGSNIRTAEDIVNKMRNPGPGMTKFTEERISDEDAKKIADYILATFE